MDQVKEILKQLIKYRFWIAVGISALLPVVAYALGSGPVQEASKKKTDEIKQAETGVKAYTNGVLPNKQYKPLVDKQTNVLTLDVNASWRKLYDRQKGLLTWPENVADRFQAWGRKWPENVDPSAVRLAVIDYVTEYPKYVTSVYLSFRPFDPIEGTGVVASPPEMMLLKPAAFKEDAPPELGKVWAAQEKLWVQRTMLDVVSEVNKAAKDWDSAIIRQIDTLEVGNPTAQDQVSIGKGEELEKAEEIRAPGAPEPEAEESSASGPMAGMMEGMMGRMGGGAGKPEDVEDVYFIKGAGEGGNDQYKTIPVNLSVLIHQDHIQDLLVALENSPMTIQVVEFEMARPTARVVKPEKGTNMTFGGGMGMMGMRGMMGMMGGRGRMEGMMGGRMGPMAGYGGPMSMMGNRMMEGMMGGPMGAYGMGGGTVAERKGVDKRATDRGKDKKEEERKKEEAARALAQSIHDPYYYLVQLTVYGQARFYNPPPPPPTVEESQADGAMTEEAKAEEPKPEEAKKDEPKAEEAKPDEAKKDEPKAEEAKPDEAKAEAPKAEGETPAKKDEAPKAEAAPAESAKKDEVPKAEAAPAPATPATPAAPAAKP
ncbi:hypothetical protein [Singulisphaera sp. PoT]|uniref:hypothetical protein n=1 Tax=Singulisphaera sp. PoT TaxID=3411797 RepID=UPI003BF4FFEA